MSDSSSWNVTSYLLLVPVPGDTSPAKLYICLLSTSLLSGLSDVAVMCY